MQARQVRQSAAENLGELTRLSMRVDNLANDLVSNACTAEPSGREAYLTALRGMLATCGARLSPATISRAGTALRQLMDGAGALAPALKCQRLYPAQAAPSDTDRHDIQSMGCGCRRG